MEQGKSGARKLIADQPRIVRLLNPIQSRRGHRPSITSEGALALRRKLGISQAKFWRRLGVTQSCGSRYETGRAIPHSIYLLMALAYDANPERAYERIRYQKRTK